MNKESETHTQTQRETNKHRVRDTHSQLIGRETHIELHTHTKKRRNTQGDTQ